MLSVINRGTIIGSDTDGLPYKLVDGYGTGSYQGNPISTIKLTGIPEPLEIEIDPIIKTGYLSEMIPIVLDIPSIVNVPINPIIKNGYEPITINPQEG